MSPEAQRIAIAEACGWKLSDKYGTNMWHNPDGTPIGFLPDFLHDLNTIHDAALSLKIGKRSTYGVELRQIVVRDQTPEMADPDGGPLPDLYFYEATAAQRAEAFLRTLGLWKDA